MLLKQKYDINTSLKYIFTISILLLISISCIPAYHNKETFEDRRLKQEKAIELRTKSDAKTTERYESLGFGPLHVYKPDAFSTLDSLYALKYKYEEEGKLREYKQSGIEELIEVYKETAKEAETEITYELEHIYSLSKSNQLTIHHDYYLLDYKDSIISHTPLYEYTIPSRLKNMQLNYLFELHFLTDNERFISPDEQAFIQFYKAQEQELIRTGKLQDFMIHTLELMHIAKRNRSVNTLDLIEALIRIKLEELPEKVSAVEFGTLLAHEDESEELVKYEILVIWKTPSDEQQKVFEFSPYLEYIHEQN